MPDAENYRVSREARADLARHATGPSSRTGEETMTRMVNAAVYRYEHQELGHHHYAPGEVPPDSLER
jgi:hypothetical protein